MFKGAIIGCGNAMRYSHLPARCHLGLIRADQGDTRMLDDPIVRQRPRRQPAHAPLPQALSTGLQEAESCVRLTLLAYQSAALNTASLSYLQALYPVVT